ncbi:MAG: B12 binding domain protein [Bacteroidetes bacterium ADurb.Bin408]|nr:MAG: B12 binding domain protein [Bacteroidetes bacterium ADurb.Bin408]
MKKKLLLILPVDRSVVHFNAVAPPLGLGIVAALTPPDWEVEIVDENFDKFDYRKADLVGISSWTVNINRAYEIAALYRQNNTPVVMGGAHVSALPDEALGYCDHVVVGGAEDVWEQFMADFAQGKAQQVYRSAYTARFVKPRHDLFHKDYILGAIQTTRGCPLNCEFCYVTALAGHKYYRKDPAEVVAELAEIPQKFVFFIDDNLGGFSSRHEEEAIALFEKMTEKKVNKYWYTQTSINFAASEKLYRAAARSGCGSVLIGFEAENIEGLESINKHLNIKKDPALYPLYVSRLQKSGIAVIAATIFGLETDNDETLLRRAEFLKHIKAASITATFLTPFPGTRLFSRMQQEGRLVYGNYPHDWKYYNLRYATYKPENENDIAAYEDKVRRLMLTAYTPCRLFIRALHTLATTRNFIAMLHSYSANLKYRNFIRGKKNSYYKLRLVVTRLLMGNVSRVKKKA